MKVYVTWKDVENYIQNLYEYLIECNINKNTCPGIFTFPRGGLILAVLLSYKTGLPILTAPAEGCIIIDDICDSGITLKKYSDLKQKKNYFITTMFVQDDQLAEAAQYQCAISYFESCKEKNWIVFPWEGKDEKEC